MVNKKRAKFAALAYQLFVVEKQKSPKTIAAALGIKYPTLYSRLTGRTPFSADEVTELIAETQDVRLADCLLAGTPFMAVDRPEPLFDRTVHSLLHDAVDAVSAVASLLRETETAVEHGPIGYDERAKIEAHALAAERTLETLRRHLPLG